MPIGEEAVEGKKVSPAAWRVSSDVKTQTTAVSGQTDAFSTAARQARLKYDEQ